MLRVQGSGLTAAAAAAAAGAGVVGLADQHIALEVNGLTGSQELEGCKAEASVGSVARAVDLVSAVYAAPAGGAEVTVTSRGGKPLFLLALSDSVQFTESIC